MTYFGFLAIFIGIPLVILVAFALRDRRTGLDLPPDLTTWPWALVLATHVLVAVLYTTPWDNYLVATRVWWYDPTLVTGLVWGWVPIEEYAFFVLQTLMTGLWLVWLARRLPQPRPLPPARGIAMRRWATATVGLVWLATLLILILGWAPGAYLALELVWALVPIMGQLAFGADILWHYRRLIFWALVPSTCYLAVADAVAITSGTWTVDPAQSLPISLAGLLPVEELLFFLLTNTLLVFGVTLVLAHHSHIRVKPWRVFAMLG